MMQTSQHAKKEIDILLVEDNPGDILLTKEGLKHAKIASKLSVARDGEEAIQYLRKEASFADAPTPDIILLDLNLPRIDGREVLGEIKKDPELRKIPVVILTSSEAEDDLTQAYSLYANCYVVKPVDFERYIEVVKRINHFWLDTVKLPPSNN